MYSFKIFGNQALKSGNSDAGGHFQFTPKYIRGKERGKIMLLIVDTIMLIKNYDIQTIYGGLTCVFTKMLLNVVLYVTALKTLKYKHFCIKCIIIAVNKLG
jgi:hypothetical protein